MGVIITMDADVFARLVDQHAPGLLLYARQWCAAPEDIVQDAFIKLLTQQRSPDNAAAWLYRVVRNAAISAQRAAQRRRRHEDAAARQTPSWFQPSDSTLDVQAVTAMLEQLPGEQREIITLHLWAGLSFAAIAEVAGCSSSSAHRWYAAGLAALRERLRVACPNS